MAGMKKILSIVGVLLALVSTTPVLAQEVTDSYQGTFKARVLEITGEESRAVFDTTYQIQFLSAELLEGPDAGNIVSVENDFQELSIGDRFYANHHIFDGGAGTYNVINVARQGALLVLVGIFVCVVVLFGRWQGVRSIVALAASFAAIMLILIPGILAGWAPLVASFLVAAVILFAAIFFTHGFNRESLVAYSGTMMAVVLAGLFAVFSVHITKLSGFAAEEAIYLNFNTGGTLNFTALLLGAFIIGFLGVLDDIAVTQSAVVTELYGANPDMTGREVFTRAMRVGREHVGALVNTLVLAYTGASMPLLLFFSDAQASFSSTVNLEIFATEIVRIIVGSIGLILTVPIVTFLAVKYLKGYTSNHTHHCAHGHVRHTHKEAE